MALEQWMELLETLSGLSKGAFMVVLAVYGGGSSFILSEDILGLNISSGDYAAIGNVMNNAYDAIAAVGYVLLVLYFLLELSEKIQMENLSVEHFIRLICKLLIGVMLISNGYDLLTGAVDFGRGIYQSISASQLTFGAGSDINNEIIQNYYDSLTTGGYLEREINAIAISLELALPSLFMLISHLIVYVVSFSRIIELAVRGMFAPIGMASIFSRGADSSGYRYFKKFVAVALQGAVIAAIMIVTGALNAQMSMFGNGGTFLLLGPVGTIVISVTSISLILKCQGWANDIVGV